MAATAKVEMINPPNGLAKAKVGSGKGEPDFAAIERAEAAIEKAGEDYDRWALEDLNAMETALAEVRSNPEGCQAQIREIFKRALDMKGQGGSFGYQLITLIGNSLKSFTESMDAIGKREIDIIAAHIGAMKTVIAQKAGE